MKQWIKEQSYKLQMIEKISDKNNNAKRNYIYYSNNGVRIISFGWYSKIWGYLHALHVNNFHRGRYSSTRLATSKIKLQSSLESTAIMFVGNVSTGRTRCWTVVFAIPRVLWTAVSFDNVGSEIDRCQSVHNLVPSKAFCCQLIFHLWQSSFPKFCFNF